jgi:hypothetical protein
MTEEGPGAKINSPNKAKPAHFSKRTGALSFYVRADCSPPDSQPCRKSKPDNRQCHSTHEPDFETIRKRFLRGEVIIRLEPRL